MRKLLILCVVIFLSYNKDSFSQRPYITEIIKLAGSNARAYFLAANRSSYGVTSYVSPKDYLELSTGTYFNDAVYEIPIDFSYGLSDNVELSAGMIAYSVSYNYLAEKISGIGDAYAGLKYLFHQSEYCDQGVQGLVKIPTASKKKELGTGKFDFHFGLAQGFFYKKFSYDLDFDFSLL